MRSRQLVDAGFRDAGVTPTVMLETDALELLHAELLGGRLASILPVAALPERVGLSGLQLRRISGCASPDVAGAAEPANTSKLLTRLWDVAQTLSMADIYLV